MATNVMVDLETMGNTPGCAMISIGAVVFSENGLGEEFYQTIDIEDAMRCGLHVDGSTLKWWLQQNPKALAEAVTGAAPLREVLSEFSTWMNKLGTVHLWGNGSDFDNVLISAAYAKVDMPLPWKFFNNRCYRTLKSLAPDVKIERIGSHHNALDDARSQAHHAVKIIQHLGLDV